MGGGGLSKIGGAPHKRPEGGRKEKRDRRKNARRRDLKGDTLPNEYLSASASCSWLPLPCRR